MSFLLLLVVVDVNAIAVVANEVLLLSWKCFLYFYRPQTRLCHELLLPTISAYQYFLRAILLLRSVEERR